MTLLLTILVFLLTVVMILALGGIIVSRRYQVSDRLSSIQKMTEEAGMEEILRLPFTQRVLVPALGNIGNTLARFAPGEIRSIIQKKILYAGTPWNLTFPVFFAVQVLLGVAFLIFSIFLFRGSDAAGERVFLMTMLLVLFGIFLPVVVINNRGDLRQKAIQRALPDTVDLLQVSVEAGLGFDMALKKVTQQMKGPLSEEIRQALDEIRIGGLREKSLRGIATRTGVSDLSSFISAVIQTEELGSNIAGTLHAQADYMRIKRRQKVEEIAMKAPTKLIFPLLFFIFPAIFVIVLGPAAISILKMFATML